MVGKKVLLAEAVTKQCCMNIWNSFWIAFLTESWGNTCWWWCFFVWLVVFCFWVVVVVVQVYSFYCQILLALLMRGKMLPSSGHSLNYRASSHWGRHSAFLHQTPGRYLNVLPRCCWLCHYLQTFFDLDCLQSPKRRRRIRAPKLAAFDLFIRKT